MRLSHPGKEPENRTGGRDGVPRCAHTARRGLPSSPDEVPFLPQAQQKLTLK